MAEQIILYSYPQGTDILNPEIPWSVANFFERYPAEEFDRSAAVAILSGNLKQPDRAGLITFRVAFERSAPFQTGLLLDESRQPKYILTLRFYNFGDMATIDVVSRSRNRFSMHQDIETDCSQRIFGMPDQKSDIPLDVSDKPWLVAGGFIIGDRQGRIGFTSSSGDYGNRLLLADSNNIAAYAARACGIDVIEGNVRSGELFSQQWLEFMVSHGRQPDFYERLVDRVYQAKMPTTESIATAQHIAGLIVMKAYDRSFREHVDLTQSLVEESTGGLSNHILLSTARLSVRQSQST